MNCNHCGFQLKEGMAKCPACGKKCHAVSGGLTPEQLAFYDKQEKKFQKEIKLTGIFIFIFFGFGVVWAIFSAIVLETTALWVEIIPILGICFMGVIGSINQKGLEKIQRERLSLDK